MKKIAIRQETLIAEDDFEAYAALSTRRDQLQNEITDVERAYGRMMKNHSPARMSEIRSISADIDETLQGIREIDAKTEACIVKKRDGLLSDMKTLRHGKKALKGYGGKGYKSPRFIDTQS